MKIGLENTIGAVHGAEGSRVEDGIITAGVVTCSRAFLHNSPMVLGDIEGLLPF